ncbi:UDP-N-acetylmuramate--L-alanine ligase [Patescibacteria group bacterium]|nr:UDP-N-acetylmuramate--L-alanine ligase [Patescibacteria group bacterium]
MKIHFIGIGGIGVSALSQYYLKKGWEVSGSDLVSSEITEILKNKGAKIFIGKHHAKNLSRGINLVIYTPAVQSDNPEFKEAKKRKIKLQSYPQALGELTKKYQTIAISGSHGKSTTCTMIALILIRAGLDPTVILGTKLREFGSSRVGTVGNFRFGKSKYLVIEADEWQASFLNYWPKIIVLTNIEREHLDYYKNLNHILKTYKKYILHLPKDGVLIANKDDPNTTKLLLLKSMRSTFSTIVGNVLHYSLRQNEAKKIKRILKIPGKHNISNALAALAVARVLKIPDKITFLALSEYEGSWRRFEIIKTKPFTLISDYAHHPTNVRVTLKAAREKFKRKKIWVVFQPHQYQRTYYLFDDFVKVLKAAPIDKLIITDIYDVAGREKKKIKGQVSSKKLVKAINKKWAICLPSIEKAANYLKKHLKGGEVVIVMGAGDIYKLCNQF